MERGLDRRALLLLTGVAVLAGCTSSGSGPEADLADILDAPVVFLGIGVPDDRIHAPDEKVEVPLLLKGAEAIAYLWADLAASLPAGP